MERKYLVHLNSDLNDDLDDVIEFLIKLREEYSSRYDRLMIEDDYGSLGLFGEILKDKDSYHE